VLKGAFVCEKLVESLETDETDLVIVVVLDQAHDDGPKQVLNDTSVLLGLLAIVVQSLNKLLVFVDASGVAK